MPDVVRADFQRIRAEFGLDLSDDMLAAAVLAWVALFGAVGFEVFGQDGPDTFADPSAAFTALMDTLGRLMGLADVG